MDTMLGSDLNISVAVLMMRRASLMWRRPSRTKCAWRASTSMVFPWSPRRGKSLRVSRGYARGWGTSLMTRSVVEYCVLWEIFFMMNSGFEGASAALVFPSSSSLFMNVGLLGDECCGVDDAALFLFFFSFSFLNLLKT